MANIEMVRMIRQDKKLSNPSKPSGRNNADFSHMLSAKAADVRDAGLPRPDGKVREKEDGGQTKPKEEPDADDFQTLKLHHDFAARFEWGMSQSIPVCGELLLEQGEAVPDLEFVKAQQSGIAEGENTARIIAESRTIPEETAAPRKMLQAEQETKGSKTMADMGLPMDGTEKLQKTGAGQDSHALRQEKAGDLKEGSKPQADEPSSQADGKIAEIGSKEKEAGRPGQEMENEAPEQAHFASAAEGGKGAEGAVHQEVRHVETIRTTRQELPADVGKTIANRMPQKNGEITIELEPASLGRIIVRVTYDADRASVALMSANPRTLEILSRDAGSIAGMIEEKTGQETVVYIPQQEAYPEESGRERGSEGREQKQQKDRKKQQSESFIQQVRLGLV